MDDKTIWKKQRIAILGQLIQNNIHGYDNDSLPIPTNAVRSHQRKDISDLPIDQQEEALFDDFIAVCQGTNGRYIQCMQADDRLIWEWASDQYKNSNIYRWMETCIAMGTSLIDLQLIISRLRNDFTRGPTVHTFCSLVQNFLRKKVYASLAELDKTLEQKTLLTLKRLCDDLNGCILVPLLHLAEQIEADDKVGGELINFLFDQKTRAECYHLIGLLDEIISLAILRYNQIIFEWISNCSLNGDLAHEFFIWDLRKQQLVSRKEFEQSDKLDWSDFDNNFVSIPELIPEDYQPISKEILNLGRYLYTMRHQNADLEHLSTQYLLDTERFKHKSLHEFCKAIVELYGQCSENILAHFKKRFDIMNLAKQLPYFFVELDSTWIYEFFALLEENQLIHKELKLLVKQLPHLLQQAFQFSWLHSSPFHANFEIRLSPFITRPKDEEMKPLEGTFPNLELHIVGNDSALKLAFPARVIEPYRKMFYHLFLINRAKYLVNRKCFMRRTIKSREEFATLQLFLRFLNLYQEYICGAASACFPTFVRKLESVRTLDQLVEVQQDYAYELMAQMKLDQDYLQLKQLIVKLADVFCEYAEDQLDFHELNSLAGPIVGQIKKLLLDSQRHLGQLKDLLFGCYFSSIGATAADEEPIWRLLLHVDDATAMV